MLPSCDIKTNARKPNKFGLDCFLFLLLDEQGILPAGMHSTDDCNRRSSGYTCTAKVLKDGRVNY